MKNAHSGRRRQQACGYYALNLMTICADDLAMQGGWVSMTSLWFPLIRGPCSSTNYRFFDTAPWTCLPGANMMSGANMMFTKPDCGAGLRSVDYMIISAWGNYFNYFDYSHLETENENNKMQSLSSYCQVLVGYSQCSCCQSISQQGSCMPSHEKLEESCSSLILLCNLIATNSYV